MVWHGLDHKSNFEPVLPLKIFGIGAFLSHFLEKKTEKIRFDPLPGGYPTNARCQNDQPDWPYY